jgi:TolB-like protein/DNA-binding winged helix-turn-helix (wHTH) protein
MARIYRFDDVEIDLQGFRLRKGERPLAVEPKVLQLLVYLAENPGRLVARLELIDAVWSGSFVTDHVLNRAIGQLRKLLGDDANEPRYIETVPTQGYRFIANVAAESHAESRQAAPSEREHTLPEFPHATRPETRRRPATLWPFALLAVTSAAGLIAVIWAGYRHFHRPSANGIRSLAVLPLENLSGDPSQEYLADGMTGELITSLGQINGLRVISQTTAMQYKNTHEPLPQIAQKLDVDAIIDGSLQRSGDRLRIVAQLVDAKADKQLWAQTYDGDLRDVLGLESQVSGAVADQIRIKLTSQEQARLSNSRTVNPQAYEAYQKGQFYFEVNSPQAAQTSLNYFRLAVKLDPNFARAWVGIARSYNFLGEQVVPFTQAAVGADAAIAKALELQPNLAEAYAERGWTGLYYHWDFPGAERDFQHALALDPNSSDAHEGLSDYFAEVGQFGDSIVETKRALEIDPNSPVIWTGYCLFLNFQRRYDEAAAKCSAALALDPNYHWGLFVASQVYFNKHDLAMAHAMWRRLGVEAPDFLAMMDEVNGAPEKGGAFDRWLKEQKTPPDPFWLAVCYAGLGRKNQAFNSLEQALEKRISPHQTTWIPWDPRFDSLRSDPRFDSLLRRAGLPLQPSRSAVLPDRASGR